MKLMDERFFSWSLLGTLTSLSLLPLGLAQTSQEGQLPANWNQQEITYQNQSKPLTLVQTLEIGLRNNGDEQIRRYQDAINEIEQERAYHRFYLPTVAFKMETWNQRLRSFSSRDNQSTSSRVPTGALGIEISDYTLFNWGKDHLLYENQQQELVRAEQALREARTILKLALISAYFNLSTAKDLERTAKEQVRHATFVYRVTREKVPLNKLNQRVFYQSKTAYLHAQQIYNEQRIAFSEQNRHILALLGETPDTLFDPQERLEFRKLALPLSDAVQLGLSNNGEIKTQRQKLENALRSFELAQRENLPLPKLSLSLGSYLHAFDLTGATTRHTTTYPRPYDTPLARPGGRNVELMAMLNFSLDLWGENGFLNSRKQNSAFYQKKIQEIGLDVAQKSTETKIRQIYKQIQELEEQVEIAKNLLPTARSQFDEVLSQFLDQKITFDELQNTLTSLRYAEELHYKTRLNHLLAKLTMAELLGMEDFPGENFEDLAIKRAGSEP